MKRLILFILTCMLMLSYSAKQLLEPTQVQPQFQQPAFVELAKQTNDLSAISVIQFLSKIQADQALSEVQREFLLLQTVHKISDMVPTIDLTRALNTLTEYQSEIYWMTTHVGRHREQLAYPIAGTASAILNDWQLRALNAELIIDGQIQFAKFAESLQKVGQQSTPLIKRLVSQMSQDQQAPFIDWTLQNLDTLNDLQLAAIAAGTANNAVTKHLISKLINNKRADGEIIRLLERALKQLPTSESIPLIETLITSQGYGANALSQLAHIDNNNDTFLHYLADSRLGGDAAFLLSQRVTPQLISQLLELLENADQLLTKRIHLLLRLSEAPIAKQLLIELNINGAKQ